jgi:Dockerin type I domain/PEP-CTERM motif
MVAQRVKRAMLAFLIGLLSAQASADPPLVLREYRFISDKSTVEVTGGFAGVDWPFNILGTFGLAKGYNYITSGPTDHAMLEPFAEFTNVKAILFDPRRASPMPSPGSDLDKTLNLSGLSGSFTVPNDLFFIGADGQGQALRLEAALSGRRLHLTGGTSDPICCDFFNYRVDAWATQLPWADFDSNGIVEAADLTIWQQHFGSTVDVGTNGDANGDGIVDASDYTVWRDQLGQSEAFSAGGGAGVPEPGTMLLVMVGTAALAVWRRLDGMALSLRPATRRG